MWKRRGPEVPIGTTNMQKLPFRTTNGDDYGGGYPNARNGDLDRSLVAWLTRGIPISAGIKRKYLGDSVVNESTWTIVNERG